MKLYTCDIADSGFRDNGLAYWTSTGVACEVDGTPMVRLCNNALMPVDKWHASRAEAMRAAAHRIEQLGFRLLAQAKNLRQDADREVPDA